MRTAVQNLDHQRVPSGPRSQSVLTKRKSGSVDPGSLEIFNVDPGTKSFEYPLDLVYKFRTIVHSFNNFLPNLSLVVRTDREVRSPSQKIEK